MNDTNTFLFKEDTVEPSKTLEGMQQYMKELHIHHSIGALLLAGLTLVVMQTLSYLLFTVVRTDLDAVLYMFSLLIAPSALFLLLLHFYELYGIAKRGERSIPLTLDLMYFLYLGFAFVTMVGLHFLYQRYEISSAFLSFGWFAAAALLCVEVMLSLLCAKYLVTMLFAPRLTHFFAPLPKRKRKSTRLPVNRPVMKPSQVYYFRKKPDVNVWKDETCFIRYNP